MVDLDKINKELRILGSSGSAVQTAREDNKRRFLLEMAPKFNEYQLNKSTNDENSLTEESLEKKNDKRLLLPKAKKL